MRTYRMQPYLQSGRHAQVAIAPSLRPCVSVQQGHQLGNILVTNNKRFPHRDIGLLGGVIVQGYTVSALYITQCPSSPAFKSILHDIIRIASE